MKLRRAKTREEKQWEKEVRCYRYFDDAVQMSERFRRFAVTAFTENYRPTFTSFDELEPNRIRHVAKEEHDTRIIASTLNQIQDELKSQCSTQRLDTLIHQLTDLRNFGKSIRDYQRDSKNYSGFQPEYLHPEYDPEYFALLVEFAERLLQMCYRQLVSSWFLSSLIFVPLIPEEDSVTITFEDSPPLPPPIFLRPQIQPNSPNFAA
jgi:hypothetical protein